MKRELLSMLLLLAVLVAKTGFAQTKIKATYGAPSLSVIMIQFGAQAGTFARYVRKAK